MSTLPEDIRERVVAVLKDWLEEGAADLCANEIFPILQEVGRKAREEPIIVNRFKVINHLPDGQGREVVVWKDKPFVVEHSIQDTGRTLKIFIQDQSPSKESK